MFKDRYDLEVTTSSAAACDAYLDAIDRMLTGTGHVEERLDAAIEADPQFALAHTARARQHQLMARGREARASMETAMGLAGGVTERERQQVDIYQHLIGGDAPAALELTRAHVQDHPRDAFALAPACGVFGTIGFSGRIDREGEHLELLEPLATHYGDDWWFLTVHAFALLETGQWQRARQLVERALEQRPDSAHGAHTLAHALYEAGADDEATRFMAEWLPGADPAGLMHCHNWWHYAILLMGAGRHEEAWDAFSENCLPGTSESPSINVFTDSSSFLWRSELSGAPHRSDTWETIREYYQGAFRRPIVFVDSHIGLVYAALGRTEELTACIAELQELGESGRLPAETTAASLTRAYEAFVGERWASVIDILEPLMGQVVRIGGSRAQRDLVTNTLLAAYVNDDRVAEATAFLDRIEDRQPSRPVAGLDGS